LRAIRPGEQDFYVARSVCRGLIAARSRQLFGGRPVLLTQPADDRWTPFEVTEPFWSRLRASKKIVTLENAGRYPIEEPGLAQMRDVVAGFIRSPDIHDH
jgi:pimeloyl-ACP methyl ester carboxylesterase